MPFQMCHTLPTVALMAWIYLVRHGETVWNAEGRLCGSSDIPLSDQGRQQAEALAERFRDVPIAAIYSSPLLRARQTAEAIAKPHRLPVRLVPELSEIDYGDWEGMAVAELAHRFPEAERCRTDDPMRFAAPNGEAFADFVERVTAAMERLARQHSNERIVCVAHQGVNRVVLCWVLGADYSLWRRLRQDPCCVNLLHARDDGTWRLWLANDTCHLNSAVPLSDLREKSEPTDWE
jgi:alpha-ribazole phosphatase